MKIVPLSAHFRSSISHMGGEGVRGVMMDEGEAMLEIAAARGLPLCSKDARGLNIISNFFEPKSITREYICKGLCNRILHFFRIFLRRDLLSRCKDGASFLRHFEVFNSD